MADFWVSAQRHWCKYCKKFIANNKPSLDIHNNGRTHKENVERFLRDVYRDGRQKKEDEQEKMKELERIEKRSSLSWQKEMLEAFHQYHRPLRTVHARWHPSPRTSSPASSTPHLPSPPTLSELQAPDPIPQNLQGRDEWAIPAAIAQPGAWKTVSRPPISVALTDEENKKMKGPVQDIPPDFQDDDEEDQEDMHSFKIREKEYPIDSIYEDNGDNNDKEKGSTAAPTMVFKKRKIGQQSGKKRIRQKSSTDD